MIKALLKSIVLLLISSFVMANGAYAMKFNDVPEGYWAYAAIDTVGDEMYAEGYLEGDFQPENYITRAEYATMIVKAINQGEEPVDNMHYFVDVDPSHWAYKYIIKAADLDIFENLDDRFFYPDEYVPRTEIITFLVNILKSEKLSKKEAYEILQKAYIDFQDIPDWFKMTAAKAEKMGIIAQEPLRRGYLDADKNVTRAQMAVFLYNLKLQLNKYLQAKIEKETSPTVVESGIAIENIIRQGDIVTIPIRSAIPIIVSGQISSDFSVPNEMFQASFADNIVDSNNNLIFSKDMILVGKILDTTRSRNFVRNGEILFELSALKNKNIYTRIMGYADCQSVLIEANKFKKFVKTIVKGRNFVLKDGQIVYIKIFKPIRVNIVTHEILD